MQVHFGLNSLRPEWSEAVACIGTFDGAHWGHQEVISTSVRQAAERELPSVLITFDRNPLSVLSPDRAPRCIAPLADNLHSFKKLGVGIVLVLPFDESLSKMSAQAFLDKILLLGVRASSLVVGHDFAMGHDRTGTTDWLQERIPTTVVPPLETHGKRISSSLIRSAVEDGNLEEAKMMLGRPFTVSGVVVKGRQLGRTIGFPTANVARSIDQVLPPDGVYASRLKCAFGAFLAATNIGFRPTVSGLGRTIESHILDFPAVNLYGHEVHVQFEHFLRPESKFDSLEALKLQLAFDVETTRKRLT